MAINWCHSMDIAFNNLINSSMQFIDNYWRQGCSFDTILDYLKYTIETADNKQEAIKRAQDTVINIYNQVYFPGRLNGDWYDDWAWWGIAFAKSFDPAYSDVVGNLATTFQNEAKFCYDTMDNGKGRNEKAGYREFFGASQVWSTCNQTYYARVEPLFDGGSWQSDFPVPESGQKPSTDCKKNLGPIKCPTDNCLGLYQVSVMNGLFLVLASQLAMWLPHIGKYQAAAKKQYDFNQNWYHHKPGTDENSMRTFSSGALVRERIGYYKSGEKVNCYDPETSWGGDQGLFIGGNLAFSRYKPVNETEKFITDVITGVSLHMIDETQGKKVMAPYTGTVLQNIDAGDYASGIGVFMRYLLLVNEKSPELIRSLIQKTDTGFKTMLLDTANYFTDHAIPKKPPIFAYFNQLSVLLTASKIFGSLED